MLLELRGCARRRHSQLVCIRLESRGITQESAIKIRNLSVLVKVQNRGFAYLFRNKLTRFPRKYCSCIFRIFAGTMKHISLILLALCSLFIALHVWGAM